MSPVHHLNPEGMPRNPAFSQGVAVDGPHHTVYIGGQNAVDEAGNIVGAGDLGAQTRQIFRNLRLVLESTGAGLEHIVKWNVMVVPGQDLGPALAVFQEEWGRRASPPAISMMFVAGLARPGLLVEMDAIAVVPE